MDLHTLCHALGGEIAGKQLLCPGPGHSPVDRSLSIRLSPAAPDGFICFSHSGDDWRDCRDYVRERLGLPNWEPGDDRDRRVPTDRLRAYDISSVEREFGPTSHSDEECQRIARAKQIWSEGVDPRRTLVEKYLREQRLLELPDELCGTVLRYHRACPWRDENTGRTIFIPALIVPFRSIDTNEITAIHRIALRPDGTKIDRRMYGIVHRAAIKLDQVAEELHIGEGLETCLAARELGFHSVWALGSAGAISRFAVIDNIKILTVLGEPNAEDPANTCALRWIKAGRRARIVVPDDDCGDLNDELIKKNRREAAA